MKPFSVVLWIQKKRSGGEKHIESANKDNIKRIRLDDGRRGMRGEEVRIKVMRTRVYLKAAAEDYHSINYSFEGLHGLEVPN